MRHLGIGEGHHGRKRASELPLSVSPGGPPPAGGRVGSGSAPPVPPYPPPDAGVWRLLGGTTRELIPGPTPSSSEGSAPDPTGAGSAGGHPAPLLPPPPSPGRSHHPGTTCVGPPLGGGCPGPPGCPPRRRSTQVLILLYSQDRPDDLRAHQQGCRPGRLPNPREHCQAPLFQGGQDGRSMDGVESVLQVHLQ